MTENTTPEVRPYGLWQSPISIESLFSQPSSPAFPFQHNGELYYLLSLAAEGGRIALMKWQDGEEVCLTPPQFNIRTAVHEYGGKCFCLVGDEFVFNNYDDGALYRQSLNGSPGQENKPVQLTSPETDLLGFADLIHWQDSAGGDPWIIAVSEYRVDGGQNSNQLHAVPVQDKPSAATILHKGSDFYAAPVVSGNRLAWMQWQQPDMPWDQAALFCGSLQYKGSQLEITSVVPLFDQPGHSVCQPGFSHGGDLLFACDEPDQQWWNLYRHDGEHCRQLTHFEMELGEPHWVFGQARWQQLGADGDNLQIACIATAHDGDRLLLLEIHGQDVVECRELLAAATLQHIEVCPATDRAGETLDEVLVVVHPEDRVGGIVRLNPNTGESRQVGPRSKPLIAEGYSQPQSMECTTRDGEQTFGYFYPPFNPRFQGPEDTLPPLIVMVHGGPTSRTSKSFHPLKQYFASLGFAVLDINHRGSTGYGRHYRQRLLGNWGEVDCMDIADAVGYLKQQHRVDPAAVFIRGGSAGGYAVLRALTRYPELFAGGACYYGIGNLITLSEITHKFEGCYTDRLVGEKFDPEKSALPASRFVKRSPIFEMDKLRAPLILFQGLRDKVVPPEVTLEVARLLGDKGIHHEYVEYENEGHGFRAMTTRIDSLQREAGFFTGIL